MAARNPKHADPNDTQDVEPVRKRTPKESCLAFCSKYFCEGQRVEKELHVDGVRADPHHRQRLAQVRERKRAVRDLLVIPEREEPLQVLGRLDAHRLELLHDQRPRHVRRGGGRALTYL